MSKENRGGRVESEELRSLKDLLDVAQVVVSTIEMEEVLSHVLHSAMKIMDVPAGSVALYDEEYQLMKLVAHHGLSRNFTQVDRWRVKEGGLTYKILHEDEVFVVEETRNAVFFNNPVALREGIRCVISVPLLSRGRKVGILYLNDFMPRKFLQERLKILPALASFAAMSIVNAELHEKAKVLACTDGLTQLYNHRQFKNLLSREFNRARRHDHRMSLIMIDVDNFKSFNDTYGHPVGDKVLLTVADLLRTVIRDDDIAARYGGEEFVILLPETGMSEALAAAERVRSVIAELGTRDLAGVVDRGITVSVGVASYPQHASQPDELIKVADDLLYRAKHEGKNRVVSPPEEQSIHG